MTNSASKYKKDHCHLGNPGENANVYRCFGSLIGKIRISRTGVFSANPVDIVVNRSLWTIAPELLCNPSIASVFAAGPLGTSRGLSVLITAERWLRH